MILWGGENVDGVAQRNGARYNPVTDTWTSMAVPGAPRSPIGHSAVWTGTEMIVFGGTGETSLIPPYGARYNPGTDSSIPLPPAPWAAKFHHSAVWTGSRMLIWGGKERSQTTNLGGSYDPVTNTWSTITSNGAPPAAQKHTAIWTGSRMVVWGGELDDSESFRSTGGISDPASDTWTPTSMVGAPLPRADQTAVWTGTEMIIWEEGGKSPG